MSLTMQAALGALLLKVPPQNGVKEPFRSAWATVLDALPANAFEPTQPMKEGGEPWMFLFLDNLRGHSVESLHYLVERYGNRIMTCRNRAGQSLIEAAFEECVTVNEKPHTTYTKMPTDVLAHVMLLSPPEMLRTPEDRGDPPGSGWLERMARLKDNHVDTTTDLNEQPEHVLLRRGANPNHRLADGQPVATLLLHAHQVKAYAEHGLDLSQATHNPLFPSMTVLELLRGRSHTLADAIAEVAPDTLPPPAPVVSAEVLMASPETREALLIWGLCHPRSGKDKPTKDDTLSALKGVEGWETRESPEGVPLVWKAMAATPSVVTELKKPRMAPLLATAVGRTDSQGRSPWLHYLMEMSGRSDKFNHGENAELVLRLMPPLDERVLVQGQGLYEQAIRSTWQGQEPGGEEKALYGITPSYGRPSGRFGEGYVPDNLLDSPLMKAPHEVWWGTLDAQQQFARDLLVRLAQAMARDPQSGCLTLPSLDALLGDPQALHPELVGVIGVVNFVKKVSGYPQLSKPILPYRDTPFETYAQPLAVTQADIMQHLRPMVDQRIQSRLVKVTDPGYGQNMTDRQRKEQQDRANLARHSWNQTTIVWRDFSMQCMAVGPTADDGTTVRRRRFRS